MVCYGTAFGRLILMKRKEIGRQRGNGVATAWQWRGNGVVMAWQRAIRGTTETKIRLETWAASQLGQAFPSHREKYPEELSKALLEAYLKSRFWRVSAPGNDCISYM